MLKTQPLYTRTESSLRDRILGEVEKNTIIILSDTGQHSGLIPWKTLCPNLERFSEAPLNIRLTRLGGEVEDIVSISWVYFQYIKGAALVWGKSGYLYI